MKRALLCLMALILGASFAFAATDYYIQNYRVDIIAGQNSVHHIVETIDVYFEGPHHGIVREIPVDYTDYNGMMAKVSNLECSDQYSSDTDNGYLVMQIGSSSRTITGAKTYVIEYDYDIGADMNEGYDELYLNIIGPDWECPILDVEFYVEVPFAACREFQNEDAFYDWVMENTYFTSGGWGNYSADNVDAWLSQYEDGAALVEGYVSNLGAYEGVTMRMDLPEGWYVGARERWDYRPVMEIVSPLLATVLLVLAAILWATYGKDNIPIIVAKFEPPKDMSPLQVGFVADSIVDDKDVISMLFYWADQGLLSIEEKKGDKYEFTKLMDIMDYAIKSGRNIPEFERKLFDGFFKGCDVGEKITFKNLERNDFYSTITETKLKTSRFFRKEKSLVSTKSQVIAVVIALASAIPMFAGVLRIGLFENADDIVFLAFVVNMFAVLANIVLFSELFRKWYLRKSNVTMMVLCAIPTLIALMASFGVEIIVCGEGSFVQNAISTIFGALMCLLGILTEKRSKYGDQVLEDILGYREFIDKVEIDELKMMIDQDPELYFHVLSYAIVLGLEEKWAKKFRGMIVPQPTWYHGYNAFDAMYLARMAGRMNRSIPAASIPKSSVSGRPGSRAGGSGFHSSGFSGGGFGGGGGHAW